MAIYDRRKLGRNKSVANRRRFIQRHKHQLKEYVDTVGRKMKLKDALKPQDVALPRKSLKEPKFNLDSKTGRKSHVVTGNKQYRKGDRIKKPQSMSGGRGMGGSPDGEGMDEFQFTLTKEEFLDIYFKDMELPNFVKEAAMGSVKYKLKRSGYTKDGIPARLNIKKTFESAIARRIATRFHNKNKDRKKKPRFLDEIDIRYNNYEKKPFPIRHAVLFCVMDTSASMRQFEKDIAKKFFLLLYLFLHKSYDNVDVRFIRHTTEASEVTEEKFFYGRETGGTMVSSAFELVDKIIKDSYNIDKTNIYIAQASDGDNWQIDNEHLSTVVTQKILPIIQYFAYIQICSIQRQEHAVYWGYDSVIDVYQPIAEKDKKLNCKQLSEANEVYPVLRELFKTGQKV